ncbi:MAG TPA: hypothetical protein VGN16_09925 [Acidobacteriaceae bacterium]|jgi:hypothetical protein
MTLRLAAAALLFWQMASAPEPGPAPEPRHFHFLRDVKLEGHRAGQTCTTLDTTVFAHAASESLNDLRVYANGTTETPFITTESATERIDQQPAALRNAGMRGGDIVFDLLMPRRPYTAVELGLNAKDFIATAKVSGSDGRGGAPVELGSFALFDLSGQHLGRSVTLPLQESTFAELHIALHMVSSPGSGQQAFAAAMVTGAEVPPSREAQTLFSSVAAITAMTQRGHETIATVHLPAHVPVERISFELDPGFHKNFLRTVNVTAKPDDAQDTAAVETLSGEISHVTLPPELVQEASDSGLDKRSLDAVLGADLRKGATVEIAVENGDDPPLPIRAVHLEMRERRLCFDASSSSGDTYTLMYGDPALQPPQYDYRRLFTESPAAGRAELGAEHANPDFVARVDERPYTERHPELLWVALIAAVAALGIVAHRTTRKRHR